MEHTKGTWEVKKEASNRFAINVNDGAIGFIFWYETAVGVKEAKANAKHICKCVNSHEALLEVCGEIALSHSPVCKTQTTRIDGLETGAICNCIAKKARQAIALAESED